MTAPSISSAPYLATLQWLGGIDGHLRLIDQTVTHTTLEESMYLASGSVALVYDTSMFGATSLYGYPLAYPYW